MAENKKGKNDRGKWWWEINVIINEWIGKNNGQEQQHGREKGEEEPEGIGWRKEEKEGERD